MDSLIWIAADGKMGHMNNKCYVTTSIPYVNASPHVGFAYEIIQADTYARFKRLQKRDVYFLTGTDENALKNVKSAEAAGKPVDQFVDELATVFESLKKTCNLSFDQFIRTTSPKHFAGAQKLWSSFRKEDVFKKRYKGLYCVGCEKFFEINELVDGLCPDHQIPPEEVEEENYFFRLSNYQSQIEELIESNNLEIVPEIRKNEVLSFVKSGLRDISISRSTERAKGWGVPVPGDLGQIEYVWVDALSNYITALDYSSEGKLYKKYWLNNPNRIHFIGKDIVRFHAVYWPAFLLSAGIPLPGKIYVHGFITSKGVKISKSSRNAISPFDQVKKYGTDAFRYYLLREIPSHGDGDYTEERFKEVYNADMANGLGNLVARVARLFERANVQCSMFSVQFANLEEIRKSLDEFRFDEALKTIWKWISDLDQTIEKDKPWKLEGGDLEQILAGYRESILRIATALQPFLPQTAEKMLKQFAGPKIVSEAPLFPRIK